MIPARVRNIFLRRKKIGHKKTVVPNAAQNAFSHPLVLLLIGALVLSPTLEIFKSDSSSTTWLVKEIYVPMANQVSECDALHKSYVTKLLGFLTASDMILGSAAKKNGGPTDPNLRAIFIGGIKQLSIAGQDLEALDTAVTQCREKQDRLALLTSTVMGRMKEFSETSALLSKYEIQYIHESTAIQQKYGYRFFVTSALFECVLNTEVAKRPWNNCVGSFSKHVQTSELKTRLVGIEQQRNEHYRQGYQKLMGVYGDAIYLRFKASIFERLLRSVAGEW